MDKSLFLTQLRSSTDAAHKALEESPLSVAITSPDISKEDYSAYLYRMLHLHTQVENFAFPLLEDLFPDLRKRSKIEWVKHDLKLLGYSFDDQDISQKEFKSTVPFALGMMYVTEGSSLGGRVILKNVEKALADNQGAVMFFSGYRENTGPFWKEFMAVLENWQQNASGEEKQEMINGAIRGFELAAEIIGADKKVSVV